MVFRVTGVGREGMIPRRPPLIMPLLLYQARLGGEQEEAKGPSIPPPLPHVYSPPLRSSAFCSSD